MVQVCRLLDKCSLIYKNLPVVKPIIVCPFLFAFGYYEWELAVLFLIFFEKLTSVNILTFTYQICDGE